MSHPRRILIVAAASLRDALVEQLALYPEFEVTDVAAADRAEATVAAGALDILLIDAEIGMGLAAAARKRFGGPIFLFGDTNGQDRDALPPSVERIARPFRFADLLLRLRAGGDAAGDVVIGARRFRPGGFDLLDEKGRRLPLTEKEAAILSRLVEADGEIVTKEILLRDIWGYRPDVTTRTLEVHLSRLRRKIATTPGARWLLTEKTGYRLIFRRAEGGTAKAGF